MFRHAAACTAWIAALLLLAPALAGAEAPPANTLTVNGFTVKIQSVKRLAIKDDKTAVIRWAIEVTATTDSDGDTGKTAGWSSRCQLVDALGADGNSLVKSRQPAIDYTMGPQSQSRERFDARFYRAVTKADPSSFVRSGETVLVAFGTGEKAPDKLDSLVLKINTLTDVAHLAASVSPTGTKNEVVKLAGGGELVIDRSPDNVKDKIHIILNAPGPKDTTDYHRPNWFFFDQSCADADGKTLGVEYSTGSDWAYIAPHSYDTDHTPVAKIKFDILTKFTETPLIFTFTNLAVEPAEKPAK